MSVSDTPMIPAGDELQMASYTSPQTPADKCNTCLFDPETGSFGKPRPKSFLWINVGGIYESGQQGCTFCRFLFRCATLGYSKPDTTPGHQAVYSVLDSKGHISANFHYWAAAQELPFTVEFFQTGMRLQCLSV